MASPQKGRSVPQLRDVSKSSPLRVQFETKVEEYNKLSQQIAAGQQQIQGMVEERLRMEGELRFMQAQLKIDEG